MNIKRILNPKDLGLLARSGIGRRLWLLAWLAPPPGNPYRSTELIGQACNMDSRISMITLGVQDLDAAIRFYLDGLGFPKMDSSPEVAFFTLSGTWLGLYGIKSLADDAAVPAARTGFPGFSLAHNVESQKEVDSVMGRAVKCGAEVTKPAAKTPWGGYSGYFADLDGYLWEIAHNPHFWVGPPVNSPIATP